MGDGPQVVSYQDRRGRAFAVVARVGDAFEVFDMQAADPTTVGARVRRWLEVRGVDPADVEHDVERVDAVASESKVSLVDRLRLTLAGQADQPTTGDSDAVGGSGVSCAPGRDASEGEW